MHMSGHIAFKDVTFSYPSRPHEPVLRNFSLDIPPGETIAFVGASGSGKSTIVSLLQRLYDVQSGEVTLDGVSVKDLNVQSLRACIGSHSIVCSCVCVCMCV